MPNHVERAANTALTVATLVVAVVLVRREYSAADSERAGNVQPVAKHVDRWESLIDNGITIGSLRAPVRIVVFSDLECPFCREFHVILTQLRAEAGEDVAYTFVHLPLRMHRFARPAARGAECAYSQRRFEQFISIVYSKQDSLGLKPWASFGRDAGVPDSALFVSCVSDTTAVSRIEGGLAAASRFGFRSTPTVIINGWHIAPAPSLDELRRIASQVIAGIDPFSELAKHAAKGRSGG